MKEKKMEKKDNKLVKEKKMEKKDNKLVKEKKIEKKDNKLWKKKKIEKKDNNYWVRAEDKLKYPYSKFVQTAKTLPKLKDIWIDEREKKWLALQKKKERTKEKIRRKEEEKENKKSYKEYSGDTYFNAKKVKAWVFNNGIDPENFDERLNIVIFNLNKEIAEKGDSFTNSKSIANRLVNSCKKLILQYVNNKNNDNIDYVEINRQKQKQMAWKKKEKLQKLMDKYNDLSSDIIKLYEKKKEEEKKRRKEEKKEKSVSPITIREMCDTFYKSIKDNSIKCINTNKINEKKIIKGKKKK